MFTPNQPFQPTVSPRFARLASAEWAPIAKRTVDDLLEDLCLALRAIGVQEVWPGSREAIMEVLGIDHYEDGMLRPGDCKRCLQEAKYQRQARGRAS